MLKIAITGNIASGKSEVEKIIAQNFPVFDADKIAHKFLGNVDRRALGEKVFSDPVARKVYREEAKTIEDIRKGILEVSSKEEPYDIFICYKETDDNGDRTVDSTIAQDVYDALTQKGYRVFFSRISLEDKLGIEYEP